MSQPAIAEAAEPMSKRQADKPVLEVVGLSKSFPVYGGRSDEVVRALRDVSLDVRRGETVAVVGESGCGKTTLLRCITGMIEPTAGSVLFTGKEVTGLSRRAWMPYRKRIQMVFQKPLGSLNRRRTVEEIVSMPLVVHGIGDRKARERRVEEVLSDVGLSIALRNRFPHQLSGGQQQRVSIARALVLKPDVIVCDEPVSSLDVSVQGKIINLLLDLQEQHGLSYLFISHDLGVVERIADRILVMYLGCVVEEGPAARILHDPKHPYTRALVGSTPRIGVRASSIPPLTGEIPSPLSPPSGCAFHPRCASCLGEICMTDEPPVFRFDRDIAARCHLYGPSTRAQP